MKHFLYIAQASKETTTCKIGITDDLARRLKTYNSTTDMDSPAKVLLQAAAKHRRQPAAVRLWSKKRRANRKTATAFPFNTGSIW